MHFVAEHIGDALAISAALIAFIESRKAKRTAKTAAADVREIAASCTFPLCGHICQ